MSLLSGSLLSAWRQPLRGLGGTGEAELVPQGRLSGPMPWVIAIMIALTAIAAASGLSLRNTAQAAAKELEGGVTIQIVEAGAEARETQARAVLDHLRGKPGLVSMRLVPQAEVDRLIEPWLGDDAGENGDASAAIPVPALIDARFETPVTQAGVRALQEELRAVAPAARADAQSNWLKPVFAALVSLQWLAIALVLLLAAALAAAVLLAARSALGANRDTIEIVHLLGGTDAQIARVFQRSIAVDAAGGGIVGLAVAALVILALGRRFASLGAGLVDHGALTAADWIAIALIPVAAVGLAMLTARLTAIHTLRKML